MAIGPGFLGGFPSWGLLPMGVCYKQPAQAHWVTVDCQRKSAIRHKHRPMVQEEPWRAARPGSLGSGLSGFRPEHVHLSNGGHARQEVRLAHREQKQHSQAEERGQIASWARWTRTDVHRLRTLGTHLLHCL